MYLSYTFIIRDLIVLFEMYVFFIVWDIIVHLLGCRFECGKRSI